MTMTHSPGFSLRIFSRISMPSASGSLRSRSMTSWLPRRIASRPPLPVMETSTVCCLSLRMVLHALQMAASSSMIRILPGSMGQIFLFHWEKAGSLEQGNPYAETCSPVRGTLHQDVSAVALNDAEAHREAHPGALGLGGKERLEDPVQIFHRYSATRVLNFRDL